MYYIKVLELVYICADTIRSYEDGVTMVLHKIDYMKPVSRKATNASSTSF